MAYSSWPCENEVGKCGVCCPRLSTCDSAKFWIDPAGGVHANNEEGDWVDPAGMYE